MLHEYNCNDPAGAQGTLGRWRGATWCCHITSLDKLSRSKLTKQVLQQANRSCTVPARLVCAVCRAPCAAQAPSKRCPTASCTRHGCRGPQAYLGRVLLDGIIFTVTSSGHQPQQRRPRRTPPHPHPALLPTSPRPRLQAQSWTSPTTPRCPPSAKMVALWARMSPMCSPRMDSSFCACEPMQYTPLTCAETVDAASLFTHKICLPGCLDGMWLPIST